MFFPTFHIAIYPETGWASKGQASVKMSVHVAGHSSVVELETQDSSKAEQDAW